MKRVLGLLFGSVAMLMCCGDVLAGGLTLQIETIDATPGSTGYVQVLLKNELATDVTLSGFSVDLALAGSGVQLTGVDDQTTPSYVFGTEGSGTLTLDSFPNMGFLLSDYSTSASGYVTLLVGQTYGLGRLAYSVDAGAAGGLRSLTIVPGAGTELVDANGDAYSSTLLTLGSGGINVRGQPAVPEPTAMAQLIGAISTLGLAWRRIRRA